LVVASKLVNQLVNVYKDSMKKMRLKIYVTDVGWQGMVRLG